jgi:hypothetical protein
VAASPIGSTASATARLIPSSDSSDQSTAKPAALTALSLSSDATPAKDPSAGRITDQALETLIKPATPSVSEKVVNKMAITQLTPSQASTKEVDTSPRVEAVTQALKEGLEKSKADLPQESVTEMSRIVVAQLSKHQVEGTPEVTDLQVDRIDKGGLHFYGTVRADGHEFNLEIVSHGSGDAVGVSFARVYLDLKAPINVEGHPVIGGGGTHANP